MAALATRTETATMDVVAAMTGGASRTRFSGRFGMAGQAAEPLMGAVEPEMGLAIVIELPERPAIGVVT